MKKLFLLSLLCLTASCSSSTKELYTNEYGYGIYASTGDSLGECYKKAYQECPNGFEKLDRVVNPKADQAIELVYECK